MGDRSGGCVDADDGGPDGLAAETIHLSESDQLRQSDQPSVILPQEIAMPPTKKAVPAAKKTAASAKAVAQTTVTLKHLAAALSDTA